MRPSAHAIAAAIALSTLVSAQISMRLQELTVTQVASGITHAGGMAVDWTGNTWIVGTQGSMGGSDGALTLVTPLGAVVPGAVTGLPEMSDLVRGNDGNVWFWVNIAPGVVGLVRLTPAGAVTLIGQYSSAGRARTIAQDSAGAFYMGIDVPQALGIWKLAPGAQTFTIHAVTFFLGEVKRILIGPGGALFAAEDARVSSFSGANIIFIHQSPPPFCTGCSSDIPDLAIDWHGNVILLLRTYVPGGLSITDVVVNKFKNVEGKIGTLGVVPADQVPALASGAHGDHFILHGNTLWQLTHPLAPPPVLTFGYAQPNLLSLNVDGLPPSPVIICADAHGIVNPIPPFGTAHTSLGVLPTFFPVIDGVGVFAPANPSSQTPFVFSIIPAPPAGSLNLAITLEAYVLSPFGVNGVFMISNHIEVFL
jgi:hypothetical protein